MSERKESPQKEGFDSFKVGVALGLGASALLGFIAARRLVRSVVDEKRKPSPLAVTYDQDLRAAPYRISFDEEGYIDLLNKFGMDDNAIEGRRLSFSRKTSGWNRFLPTIGTARGVYNPLTDRTELYTDWLWKKYRGDIKRMNREANKVLVHETKHMLDFQYWPWKVVGGLRIAAALSLYSISMWGAPHGVSAVDFFAQYGSLAVVALGLINSISAASIIYGLDPMELRARNFAKKHDNVSLIEITPAEFSFSRGPGS